ncbi:MAG: DEAD/DEAH box helicase [Oligoflexales bacterium]
MTQVSFDQFNLPKPLISSLVRMNFTTPTPVQEATLTPALEGRDILATAQTGTGKTGAFGIPTLATIYSNPGTTALVLAPTRELAAQILKVFLQMSKGTKLKGALLVGGESFTRQVYQIRSNVDFIIATPGRLNDHLQQGTVDLSRVGIFVLDEVDRMLDMGFAPQIKQVLNHVPTERQTLLFSATLPDEVMKLVNGMLKDPVKVTIGSASVPAAQIDEQMTRTSQDGKIGLLLEELGKRAGKVLIFVRTKSRTDRLAKTLINKGFSAVFMHGGRSNGQRSDALKKYRAGSHRIMVATDVAGRGIDVADIEQVINYDVPATREDYIHRIGRTARIGNTGIALTFVTDEDDQAEYIVTGKKKAAAPANRFRPRANRNGFRGRRRR